MEHHLKASIIYTISGLLAFIGAGVFAYAILVGITIPTVAEEFTNKLLFYSIVIVFFSYQAAVAFITQGCSCIGKAREQWKLRVKK